MKRSLELDFLRGIAVLLVIVYHANALLPENTTIRLLEPILTGGWAGVDLFFVLSGYLVSGILFREYMETNTVKAGRFLLRRGLKIYPAFYLCLFVSLFLPLSGHYPSAPSLLIDTFYLQSYFHGSQSHFWSLAVEEHFYILLIIWVVVQLRTSRPFRYLPETILLLAVITLAIRVSNTITIQGYDSFVHYRPTHIRLDSLAFGVLISYYHHFEKTAFEVFVKRWRRGLLVGGLLFCAPAFFLDIHTSPFVYTAGYTLLYLGCGALVSLAAVFRLRQWKFIHLIGWIGKWSFSIYLWHKSVIYFFIPMAAYLTGRSQIEFLPAYFVTSILLGAGMGLLVEQPILRIRDKVIPSQNSVTQNEKQILV